MDIRGAKETGRSLTEAFQELPQLDRAEFLEPAKQLLIRRLHENPPGGSRGLAGGRDEVDPPARRLFARSGLEKYPPGYLAPIEVTEVTRSRMVRQLDWGGGHSDE